MLAGSYTCRYDLPCWPKGAGGDSKSIRDRLGIAPGDEVDFSLDGAGVRVEPVREQTVFAGAWRAGVSFPSSKPITERNATCDGVSRFVGCTRLAGG